MTAAPSVQLRSWSPSPLVHLSPVTKQTQRSFPPPPTCGLHTNDLDVRLQRLDVGSNARHQAAAACRIERAAGASVGCCSACGSVALQIPGSRSTDHCLPKLPVSHGATALGIAAHLQTPDHCTDTTLKAHPQPQRWRPACPCRSLAESRCQWCPASAHWRHARCLHRLWLV